MSKLAQIRIFAYIYSYAINSALSQTDTNNNYVQSDIT